jgi:hypothetical protein
MEEKVVRKVYYHYASIPDARMNTIVVPNEHIHRFFRRLKIKIYPLELADLVHHLDPTDLGYIHYESIRDVFVQTGLIS